jgi:hypothetical protein
MLEDILQKTFLGNSVKDYLIFLAVFIVGLLIIKVLKSIVLRRLKAWSETTSTTIDDFLIDTIEGKVIPLLYFGVLYLAFNGLTLSDYLRNALNIVSIVVVTYFGIRLLVALINYSLERYWVITEVDTTRQRSLKGIITLVKFVIWGVGITFLLDNLGFKISAVVAGLGIGGIAVALAAQAVLGDLFSYFVIFFDRPFEIGDFIIVDSYLFQIQT